MGNNTSSLCVWSRRQHDYVLAENYEKALTGLYNQKASVERVIESKSIEINDTARKIRIVNNSRAHGSKLTPVQRSQLMHLINKKKRNESAYDRYYNILTKIDENIELLRSAAITITSMFALRESVSAHSNLQLSIEDVEKIMDDIHEQQENAADTQQIMSQNNTISQQIEGWTDEELEQELEQLINEDDCQPEPTLPDTPTTEPDIFIQELLL